MLLTHSHKTFPTCGSVARPPPLEAAPADNVVLMDANAFSFSQVASRVARFPTPLGGRSYDSQEKSLSSGITLQLLVKV